MSLIRISQPEPLVTLDRVKQHLRVDHAEEDELIQMYLDAALSYVDGPDGVCGRQFMPAQYRWVLPAFPPTSRGMRLPMPPTISVDRISYRDQDGVEIVLDPSVYHVTGLNDRDRGALVQLGAAQSWPTVYSAAEWEDRAFIEFTAGYENPDSPADHPVPGAVRQAVLMLMTDFYETRTGSVVGTTAAEMPQGVMTLLAPHRLYLPEACT